MRPARRSPPAHGRRRAPRSAEASGKSTLAGQAVRRSSPDYRREVTGPGLDDTELGTPNLDNAEPGPDLGYRRCRCQARNTNARNAEARDANVTDTKPRIPTSATPGLEQQRRRHGNHGTSARRRTRTITGYWMCRAWAGRDLFQLPRGDSERPTTRPTTLRSAYQTRPTEHRAPSTTMTRVTGPRPITRHADSATRQPGNPATRQQDQTRRTGLDGQTHRTRTRTR
jgi:hypothetical protein